MRGRAGASTRTRSTAASTPSPTPARCAARGCGSWTRDGAAVPLAHGRSDRVVAAARAGRGRDRRGQGARRLSPRLRRRPTSAAVVGALRARKHREDKPFALMVADVEAAARLLVLLGGRGGAAAGVGGAPDRAGAPAARRAGRRGGGSRARPSSGVMLPYTPLHHLLLADFARRPAAGDDQRQRLRRADRLPRRRRAGAAGARSPTSSCSTTARSRRGPTTRSCGSSTRGGRSPLTLRRSRGYVPGHLALPVADRRPLLACGAEQKNTFCVAKGARAWVSPPHRRPRALLDAAGLPEGIAHFERLFAVTPEVVVHDLHPGLPVDRSTRLSARASTLVGVQHHHAHLAACLAEHGVTARRRGRGDLRRHRLRRRRHRLGRRAAGRRAGAAFERAGVAAPGADARRRGRDPPAVADGVGVARRGVRRAAAAAAGARAARSTPRAGRRWLRWRASPAVSPLTSSMGRLFDAVGALCGLRRGGHLRGSGRGRARGGGLAGRAAAAPTSSRSATAGRPRPAPGDPRARRRPRAPGRRRRRGGALSRRRGRGHRGCAAPASRPSAGSRPPCSAAACSRTGCCWRPYRRRRREPACGC